jgi:hypothetical protein
MITARPIPAVLLGLTITSLVAFSAEPRQDPAEPRPQAAPGIPPARKGRDFPPELVDPVTRQATCKWAAKPPVLDGKLDDPCWQQAVPIDRFASFWTKTQTPRPGTIAYLVWDDTALYYAASMHDTELRAHGDRRNDSLWDGDVFELFFKPSDKKPEYYEFQGNPRELVFEAAWPERGRDYGDLTKLPVLGSKAVVALKGTLDQPGDKDESWTVEGRIPWSAFAMTGGKPKPGDEWLFALCRYDYGPKGTEPKLMSSAPLTKSSFHRYEDYGKLRFEGNPRGRRGQFTKSPQPTQP